MKNPRASAASCLLVSIALSSAAAGMSPERGAIHELRARGLYEQALQRVETLGGLESPPCDLAAPVQALLRQTLGFAAALSADNQNKLAEADGLTPIILDHIQMHRFGSAAEAATRQLALRFEVLGGGHADLAQSLYFVGTTARRSASFALADELLRRAYAIRKKHVENGDLLLAQIVIDRMITLKDLSADRSLHTAEPYRVEAQLLLDQAGCGADSHRANLLHAWGNTLRAAKHAAEAVGYYEQALAIRRGLPGQGLLAADNTIWLAHLLSTLERFEESELQAREAVRIFADLGIEEHPVLSTSLVYVAYFEASAGKLDEAIRLIRKALLPRTQSREEMFPLFSRRHYARDNLALLKMLLRAGRHDETWEPLNLAVGEVARDFIAQAPLSSGQALRPSWDVLGDSSAPELTSDDVVALQALASDWRRHSRPEPEAARVWPLSRVQAQLGPNQAMVTWLHANYFGRAELPSSLWALVLRNDGEPQWILCREFDSKQQRSHWRAPARLAVRAAQEASAWPPPVQVDSEMVADCRTAHDRFFRPLLPYLDGVDHLLLLPSRLIRGVELWQNPEGKYLDEVYRFSYADSPTLYAQRQESTDSNAARSAAVALIIGDPTFDPDRSEDDASRDQANTTVTESLLRSVLVRGDRTIRELPALPSTRREAERTAALFAEARLLTGLEASEKTLQAMARTGELARYDIIHVATHALTNSMFPERNALALSPAPGHEQQAHAVDGLLTSEQIFQTWSLDADLVVLSACQTAERDLARSEAALGFPQVLQGVGARSLLLSHWKVNDRSTELFMQRFYESLTGNYADLRAGRRGAPLSKLDALDDAKRYLREYTDSSGQRPYDHPTFWAAFALYGSPD